MREGKGRSLSSRIMLQFLHAFHQSISFQASLSFTQFHAYLLTFVHLSHSRLHLLTIAISSPEETWKFGASQPGGNVPVKIRRRKETERNIRANVGSADRAMIYHRNTRIDALPVAIRTVPRRIRLDREGSVRA